MCANRGLWCINKIHPICSFVSCENSKKRFSNQKKNIYSAGDILNLVEVSAFVVKFRRSLSDFALASLIERVSGFRKKK